MTDRSDVVDFEIIWKKINCSLSPDEEKTLAKWLKGDKNRQEFFNKAVEFYKDSSEKNADLSTTQKGWEKISEKIFSDKK
ncbi:MAG: hypothetical protein ABFS32_18410 [Bacteroidota bacterium]